MYTQLRIRTAIWSSLALFLLIGAAWAQTPNVTLSASRVAPDTVVTLRARGLEPETPFQLELRRSDGTTSVEELASNPRGNLASSFTPAQEGMWIVRLRGPGVHSIFGLAVTAPVETTPVETADPVEAAPRPDAFRIEDDDVVAMLEGDPVWRLTFTPDSGPTGPLFEGDTTLWVPHGLSLLAVDPATGAVVQRTVVPAPVTTLEADGEDLVVGVTHESGHSADLRVRAGVASEAVRFGTHVEAFGWLRNEGDVADPLARLEIDPTNPWLYFFGGRALERDTAGVEEGTGRRADLDAETGDDVAPLAFTDLYQQAIEHGQTFFDLAGIGAELYAAGEESLASRALDAAFRDFADRGYDPGLLTEPQLQTAYAFPLAQLQEAIANGDRAAASFWAPWAYRMAGGSISESRQALRDYASMLRAGGDRQGASLWSARAGELLQTRIGAVVDRAFLGIAQVGWLAVLAMISAGVLLYLALTAKYWRPQSLHLRQRREAGRKLRPWARAVSIRFFSFTEKLVLLLLLAGTLALGGLVAWDANATVPDVAGSGTLASAPAREFVAGLDGDPTRTAFVSGYVAQVVGDDSAARIAYRDAGDFAPAVNNLAALDGEERLYQRALELAPGLPAPRYNLGRITSPSPFHETYRPGQPLLTVPSTADLKIATAGPWRASVAGAFTAPWAELRTTTPGIPVWLWTVVLALFFVVTIAVVVALAIPRPRVARSAPRTLLYHGFALLVPGTGLADELWGVLLLAPWSILGLDLFLQWTGAASPLGIDYSTASWALIVIYAVNLVAFVVEFLSYRRRMRELKKRDPELARRFGLRA